MPPERASTGTPTTEIHLPHAADLLGGQRWLGGAGPESPLELHDLMVRGFPAGILKQFARSCPTLAGDTAFNWVLSMVPAASGRPYGRRGGRLSSHESGQLWRLATVVVRAAPLFGGIEAAQRWLVRPAIGLDRWRPLDLLETPPGAEMVNDHLTQLEYSVYI